MTADYLGCLQQLGVETITDMPRATDHIPEMIHIIQTLIDKGHAYRRRGGDAYFDVTRDPDYGKLCNRDPEQMEAGARIEVSEKKRNPGDFALWKAAKPGEPKWDSPWGPGRPGWHIECSAMSMKLLGKTLDIHGGGLDLQFPHHENELAQSESYSDEPFARYWMHNGLMKLRRPENGRVGWQRRQCARPPQDAPGRNAAIPLAVDALSQSHRLQREEHPAGAARRGIVPALFRALSTRITGGSFYDVKASTQFTAFDLSGTPSEFLAEMSQLRGSFLELMLDDFNTGGAVGVLYELLTALNRFADTMKLEEASPTPEVKAEFLRGVGVLRELGQILGLFREPISDDERRQRRIGGRTAETAHRPGQQGIARGPQWTDAGADCVAREARKTKNFAIADQIRKRLEELKVTLEDRPGGTGWRVG